MKVSTDRPRAMTGTPAGLKARVKKMNPSIIWHHCCIHTETLAAKNMPEKFKIVLDDIVQVVNVIKARPINFRIFGVICEEMGSIHKQLLLHVRRVCCLVAKSYRMFLSCEMRSERFF